MKRLLLVALLAMANNSYAAPDTYVIDGNHTFPRFSYNHMGYSTQISRFDKTTGTIVIDEANKTGTVNVVVDTKSVDTGSTVFNEHIQGADFLDTATYPTATFIGNKVNFTGDKITSIDGNLTLKGVTKPLSLTVTSFSCMLHPMLMKYACGANASAQLKRSDFNMGKYAPLVGDEITISIAVEAAKE